MPVYRHDKPVRSAREPEPPKVLPSRWHPIKRRKARKQEKAD
jgi:hypothetical protein